MARKKWTRIEIEWGVQLAREIGTDPSYEDDDFDEDFDDDLRGMVEDYLLGPLHGVADLAPLVPGAHPDDIEALRRKRDEVLDAIGQMDNFGMQAALQRPPLHDFGGEIAALTQAVRARALEAERIRGEVTTRETPKDADEDQAAALVQERRKVLDCLAPVPLAAGDVEAAKAALGALDETLGKIVEAIGKLKTEIEEIGKKGAEVPRDAPLKDQRDRLKKAGDELAEALKGPATAKTRDAANEALDRLTKAAEEVRAEVEEFGGNEAIAGLCAAFGAPVDDFEAVEAKFGGRKPMQALLKAVPVGDIRKLNDAMTADGLAAAVKAFATPAAMAEAAKDLGGAERFAALCTKSASPEKARELVNDLGAGFVGALMGDTNDPAGAVALHGAFGGNVTPLKDLMKEGGFAKKPKALAALLTAGCDNKPDQFVAFCKGFDGKEAREDLAGLVDAGGLGDAPEAFGVLLKTGCDGKPEGMKAMATAFKDPAARTGLKGLLEDGGLKGQKGGDGDIGNDTLAMMLKHGAGPRPPGAVDAEEKRRAEMLAGLAKGMDKAACDRLKGTLAKGGLGAEPEVFGHVLGHGCKGGDPGRLNALTTELAAGGRQEKLKKVLLQGGFGAKDDTGAATGIKTECLGKLVGKGCEGKPAEVSALLDALGDQDIARMKGLMKTGELGKHPDVLANAYKHGCLADPTGAHDGAKDPALLKRMMTSFGDPQGQALFKNMLTGGGFDEAGKEERLGSMLRHAFTPPSHKPNPGKQRPEGLRQLANSFTGHFGELKTMMAAMEAAPGHVLETSTADEPNQPGKGLGNVIHAPKFNGNPTTLRTQFFQPLNARATGGNVGSDGTWAQPPSPPRMGMQQLLQTGASFQHKPIANPVVPCSDGAGHSYDLDMEHVAGRHSRAQGKFHLNTTPEMGTTLYPRETDETKIKKLVEDSLKNGGALAGGPAMRSGPPPPAPRNIPPQDVHDLVGPVHNKFMRVDANDGTGERSRIGFKKIGGGPIHIAQFYPQAGAGLEKIQTNDFITLRNALTNNPTGYR